MTDLLEGEYEPSAAQWVRDQVATYEATGGKEGNILRGRPDWPIVVITSRGVEVRQAPQEPGDAGGEGRRLRRDRLRGRRSAQPRLGRQLLADPVVQLQDGPEPALYRARLAEGDERQEWWDHAVATWSTYASYQEKTDRQIPVFLLEKIDA